MHNSLLTPFATESLVSPRDSFKNQPLVSPRGQLSKKEQRMSVRTPNNHVKHANKKQRLIHRPDPLRQLLIRAGGYRLKATILLLITLLTGICASSKTGKERNKDSYEVSISATFKRN